MGSGVCFCNPGWKGEDCSAPACKNDCGGPKRGVCVKSGQCYCMSGWEGPSCLSRSCPNDCSGHGVCNNGTCVCEGNFAGSRCDQVACLKLNGVQCAGNGHCVSVLDKSFKAVCQCDTDYVGDNCETKNCPKGCSGHGLCHQPSGKCLCDTFWNVNN